MRGRDGIGFVRPEPNFSLVSRTCNPIALNSRLFITKSKVHALHLVGAPRLGHKGLAIECAADFVRSISAIRQIAALPQSGDNRWESDALCVDEQHWRGRCGMVVG